MWGNGILTAHSLCCREGENEWFAVASIFQPSPKVSEHKPVAPPKTNALNSRKPQAYSKNTLLRVVLCREAMVSAYLASVVLSLLTAFINAPTMIVIALLSWIVSAVTFFMIVRALNGSVFAAVIAFIAAFVPLLCLITVFFLYGWAERDLKDAGITLDSSARMKQQIKRLPN